MAERSEGTSNNSRNSSDAISEHASLPSTSAQPPLVNLHISSTTGRRLGTSDRARTPPRVQELVRLENPRPGILRSANEYISVPAAHAPDPVDRLSLSPSRHHPRRHRMREGSKESRQFSSPTNFDRPKVHVRPIHKVTNGSNCPPAQAAPDLRGLGEIKPLVQAAEMPPPLPLRPLTGGSLPKNAFSTVKPSGANALHTASLPRRTSPAFAVQSSVQRRALSSRSLASSNIICPQCGRCRCVACTEPRQLPSRWLCDESVLLSADTLVDCLSCMCCVRAALYHLNEEPDVPQHDQLLSCAPDNCCERWTCVSLAALLLPCIWCYLPLKACSHLCAVGYARFHEQGCRCRDSPTDLTTPPISRQPDKMAALNSTSHLMPKSLRLSTEPTAKL